MISSEICVLIEAGLAIRSYQLFVIRYSNMVPVKSIHFIDAEYAASVLRIFGHLIQSIP